MPPLTKAQRRRLQDQGFSRRDLEAIESELGDDDADDDDEPRGGRRRRRTDAEVAVLSGATAERFLAGLGFGSSEDEADGDDGGDGEAGEASEEEPEPEEDEEHEPDAQPASGPRYFRDKERSA